MNDILSILTGNTVNETYKVIEQGFNSYNTGCLIKTKEVHCINSALVLAIEKDPRDNTWSITTQVNVGVWIRYNRLSSVNISVGDNINLKDNLGMSYKGIMRLEYCTANKSEFPVRILNKQLYKHDPTPIIFGQINLSEVI